MINDKNGTQNTPNPFSTGTKINYYLPARMAGSDGPEGTQGASLIFYDSYGNQLKVVTLTQTGNGNFNITYALNPGQTGSVEVYNYMGSKVLTYSLDENSDLLEIAQPNLPDGVYLYRFFVNNTPQTMGKFVIIKN